MFYLFINNEYAYYILNYGKIRVDCNQVVRFWNQFRTKR